MTTKPQTPHQALQSNVVKILGLLGVQHLHVRKSVGYRKGIGKAHMTTTNISGWPDFAPLWKTGSRWPPLAVEFKVPPDKLSVAQLAVRASLEASGWWYAVITPKDVQALADALAGVGPWPGTDRLLPS